MKKKKKKREQKYYMEEKDPQDLIKDFFMNQLCLIMCKIILLL